MVSKKRKDRENIHVQQLLTLFPNGDPDYFQSCLEYYQDNPVERIAEKLTVYYGSQYPRATPHRDRLNNSLKILALDLFPQCDVGFLRDLLLQNTADRIENLVDQIVSCEKLPERLEYGKLDPTEEIKSKTYKLQAETQLVHDFPQIWKSSIRAVLAENNWDYINSFDQLNELGSGGLWNMLKNLVMYFSRPFSHQFIPITDKLLKKHIKQLHQRSIHRQIQEDKSYAHQINYSEYTDNHQLMTCDCCYSDYTFEQLSFCTEGDHSFCHECLSHYITEGLFGQGALRGKPRIDCISSTDDCAGCFSTQMLKQILSEDIWKAYENSLLEDFSRGTQRLQCCACPYFELDESIKPLKDTILYNNAIVKTFARWFMVFLIVVFIVFKKQHESNVILYMLIPCYLLFKWCQWDIQSDLEVAHARVAKSRRGGLFTCQNKNCRTVTCLDCFRPVRGSHTCWEKETDGLRLYVEKAMADAVKRTCPNCSLSFQKSDGCNKITCRCGYAMCYICRKDIGKESYAHFCNHFRERPGTKCTECTKCDLYKTDPENELIEKAATKAKQQYIHAHPELKQSSQTNIIIGPKSTFIKLGEWKQESVIWCLEKGIELFV